MSTDRMGHLFRLNGGILYRHLGRHASSWVEVPVIENLNLKSVLSLNGQPVVITEDGRIKMIGSGGKLFRIFYGCDFKLNQTI